MTNTSHTRGNEMAKTIKAKAWIAYNREGVVVIDDSREMLEERWEEGGHYHIRCLELEIPVPKFVTQKVALPEADEDELVLIAE